MDIDQLWSLIEANRQANRDSYEQAIALQKLLEPLDLVEIVAFQEHFWERLDESYRWDLWGFAYIVDGFCSDDGFEYFRVWLIRQGREYFEAALQQPEHAAEQAERRKRLFEKGEGCSKLR